MTRISLTDTQIWFIKCAIESAEAVLPFPPNYLTEEQWVDSYGCSSQLVRDHINDLKNKIKKATT